MNLTTKLLLVLIAIGVLFWLTGGVLNLNLSDVCSKALNLVDEWYEIGGWHRIAIILICVSWIIIPVLIAILKEKKNE